MPEGLSGVATQMMDAADQKMPILSVNSRRKFFHALAVVMFVPGIAIDVSVMSFNVETLPVASEARGSLKTLTP